MNNKFPEVKPDGFIPEEAAVTMRVRVFVNMRWFAILAIIFAAVIASTVFHIGFSPLPVYIICIFLAIYNAVLWRLTRNLTSEQTGFVVPRVKHYLYTNVFIDLTMLIVLIHYTGGIENPFIFLLILYVILAGIGLSHKTTYFIATGAFLMVGVMVTLEYTGLISHINLEGFMPPDQYKQASYIVAILVALAVLLYSSTYLTTAVSGELRKRQRQVVALSQQLLVEKETELDVSAKEIDKLEEEKKRFLSFLGMAAHDLKAPLAAIQGFLWLILTGYTGKISDKQRDMLDRSSRRINDLVNLISDLLDIPRIEAGQLVQEMKDVSLNELIKRCADDFSTVAKEKGLDLNVEVPETMAKIKGSDIRLRQVVTNLLSNALNYTLWGSVTIRATETELEQRVEVMDTGIGIPPQELPKLFYDFFRGSNVSVKGTGLGLAISKRIIEAHGGKIWAESPCPETNKGSKFIFTIPGKS